MICLSSLAVLLCFAHRERAGGVFQQYFPTGFEATTRSLRKDLNHVAGNDTVATLYPVGNLLCEIRIAKKIKIMSSVDFLGDLR